VSASWGDEAKAIDGHAFMGARKGARFLNRNTQTSVVGRVGWIWIGGNNLFILLVRFGWWIESEGLDTNFRGGFPNPDYNNESRPFFALSMQDLNCLKIKE
jgi:hypothetical protein